MNWTRYRDVVAGMAVVVGAQLLGQFVGCKDPVFPKDDTAALIAKCKAEALKAHREKDASIEQAAQVYDDCILDGGSK